MNKEEDLVRYAKFIVPIYALHAHTQQYSTHDSISLSK